MTLSLPFNSSARLAGPRPTIGNTPIVHKVLYPALGMGDDFPLRNLEQRGHIYQKASMFNENTEEILLAIHH